MCKRQPASLPCCYYHRPVLALLHRGKWDVLFSRKSWQKAEGQTSCTWQLPSHLPLATLPLCRHRLLFVRIQQQRETKSAFASKKTGQEQPPATPDSNPASSGNRKHFLRKNRYSRACLNHPSTTRRLGKELQQEQSISQLPDVSLLQLSEFFRSLLQGWSALIAGG